MELFKQCSSKKILNNKVMKLYIYILLTMVLLASCSNDKCCEMLNDQPYNTVSFTATTAGTKATSTSFETDDSISVFAVKSNDTNIQLSSSGNFADNYRFIYNGNKFIARSSTISYPSDGTKLHFFAVYPYNSLMMPSCIFSVKTDQSNAKDYTQSDLMTAVTSGTTELMPNLKFDHRLSNIIINLTGTNLPSGSQSMTFMNIKYQTNIDLNTDSYTATGITTSILASSAGTNSFRVIIPPQIIESGTEIATVKIGTKEYKWNMLNAVEFKSSKQYTYNLSLSDLVEVNPGSDIEDFISPAILNQMKPYLNLYSGITPPNIEGTYYMKPCITVFCQDEKKGGYAQGDTVNAEKIKFFNQNKANNTLDYTGEDGDAATNALIRGSGYNFTAYFNATGQYSISSDSIVHYKTALVISGTKTSAGIANIRYAFAMVEKTGDSPTNPHLMGVGVFRVFKDGDELATNTTWTKTVITKKCKNIFSHFIYQTNL